LLPQGKAIVRGLTSGKTQETRGRQKKFSVTWVRVIQIFSLKLSDTIPAAVLLTMCSCRFKLSQRLVLDRATDIFGRHFVVKENDMFLTTKLNLLSGIIIGASAVLLMKEMCKGRCKQKHKHEHQHDSKPMEPGQETLS
jgi:hypothetical protein